jgi:hypothetical protein
MLSQVSAKGGGNPVWGEKLVLTLSISHVMYYGPGMPPTKSKR